jgi:N-acetylmuramoyl-L-alanine amidase
MKTRQLSPVLFAPLLALAVLCGARAAVSDGPLGVSLTSMRYWSAPAATRVVLDFSSQVSPVAPDSGKSQQLTVSLPADRVTRSAEVAERLAIQDGAVDSVRIVPSGESVQIRLWFRDSTRFRVFPLTAELGKPFRLVIDVSRPGGAAAEERRIASVAASKKRDRVRVVAVDAGHGGEDAGAQGPRVLEKSVTLAVAKALVDELNAGQGVRGVLTRDGDYFIPLRERYRIAERMKADLFISIHANSSKRRGGGSGSEVYFLSLRGASDQADADLADLENAADLVGGVPQQAEDDLVNILYDVKRSSALQQSQLLAETLLGHVGEDRRLQVRGVKQAGFVVLKSVEFPSVLVETAFINNPTEAKLLRDPVFQKKMGKQLAEGVRKYFQRAGIGMMEAEEEMPGPPLH